MKFNPSKNFKVSLLVLLSLIFLIFALDLFLLTKEENQKIREQGQIIAKELNVDFQMFTGEIESIGNTLITSLSLGEITEDELLSQLDRTLRFEHEISSIGVLFTPYSFDESLRLYSPYVINRGNVTETHSFDSVYDYTSGSVPWYGESIELENNWTAPFYDEIVQDDLVYFTKTFRLTTNSGKDAKALLFIGVSTKNIRQRLESMELDYLGQTYIVTEEGRDIIKPLDVRNDITASLGKLSEKEVEFVKTRDLKTEETVYQFISPLSSNDWVIVFEIIENDILVDYSEYRKKVINVVVSLLILITALLLYFFNPLTKNGKPARIFWVLSIPLCLIYILGSIYICKLGLDYQDKSVKERNAILNKSLLEDYKLDYIKHSLASHNQSPVFVPTGIFLESIDFTGSNSVDIKGIIWQKYYKGIHDGIERTMNLVNANSLTLNKFFEREFNDHTLIEWEFKLNMNPEFNYSKYPFSSDNLWLELGSYEFDKNIVLVPDLSAYELGSSKYLPGLNQKITSRGWEISNSYFSYEYTQYNTNFGIDGFIGQRGYPELFFNVIMRPNIINVFISNFLPIGIAIFLIYGIFKTATGHYVIRPYATIFLALIFLQISLRSRLGASEIIYIEYYYFLTYFIMAGVSLNAVLVQNSNWWVVHYKNNLISKLFFWPLTGLAILILNALVFYN